MFVFKFLTVQTRKIEATITNARGSKRKETSSNASDVPGAYWLKETILPHKCKAEIVLFGVYNKVWYFKVFFERFVIYYFFLLLHYVQAQRNIQNIKEVLHLWTQTMLVLVHLEKVSSLFF